MSLHVGNRNVYDIRVGSRVVSRVYKGSVLVWQKRKVLFESGTPGTYSLYLPTGNYRMTIHGGGGGSSNWAGGAGAFLKFTMKTGGNATVTVGGGGAGAASSSKNHRGAKGGESSVKWGGYSAVCEGGQGSIGFRDGDESGSGSTYTYAPSYNLPGANIEGQSSTYRPRSESWISGTNYGRGGPGAGNESPGNAGYAGYVKIETI